MSTLILLGFIVFGALVCLGALLVIARARHTPWREVLLYFGLANPPPPQPVTDEDLDRMVSEPVPGQTRRSRERSGG